MNVCIELTHARESDCETHIYKYIYAVESVDFSSVIILVGLVSVSCVIYGVQ